MNTIMKIKVTLLLSVIGVIGLIKPAAAETVNCVNIVSLPTVISTQGVYCLKQHLATVISSGSAIVILTNNVTIDCNEFKIGDLGAGSATNAVGITADNRMNVAVRNCGIRGFRNGVSLTNGEYRVEDNNFDQNTQTGILVSGDGSAVRRNEVINTGDSAITGLTAFMGIYGQGEMDVIDNTVSGVIATTGSNGDVYGIQTQGMNAGTIKGNRVRLLAANGTGLRRGVWNSGGNHSSVQANTVVLDSGLLAGEAGIRCGDALVLNNVSRENTVMGTGVPGAALGLINCTTAGEDFVNPL